MMMNVANSLQLHQLILDRNVFDYRQSCEYQRDRYCHSSTYQYAAGPPDSYFAAVMTDLEDQVVSA